VSVEGGLLGTPGLRRSAFGLALLSLECVLFGGESSLLTTTDVFSDDASVDAFGSRVVSSALVPAHSVTPRELPRLVDVFLAIIRQ
jgi:hypothetical protein